MALYCTVFMYMIYVYTEYILKTCVLLALELLLFGNLIIWSFCFQRKKKTTELYSYGRGIRIFRLWLWKCHSRVDFELEIFFYVVGFDL